MTQLESDVQDSSTKKKWKFAPPKWTMWVIVVFAGVGIAWFIASRNNDAASRSVKTQAALPSDKRALAVAGVEGSDEFNKKISAYAENKAMEAARDGKTYVAPAIPATASRPEFTVKEKPGEAPAVITAPPTPQAQTRQQYQQPPSHSRGDQNMAAFFGRVDARLSQRGKAVTQLLNKPAPMIVRAASPENTRDSTAPPGIKAGDILYSVNRVTLDSDAPGPAMVEVVDGPYTGAKAIGGFRRMSEHLTLEFDALSMPDGTEYSIKGYAIDPRTDRTAVRSSVDTHALERWAKLGFASLVEGWSDAARMSGSSAYSSPYGSGYNNKNFTLEEQLLIAGGKLGQRAARILERDFDIPPTVILKSGTDIGILIVTAGTPKNPSRAQKSMQNVQEEQNAANRRESQYYNRSMGSSQEQQNLPPYPNNTYRP
ncbi:MAG: hypothetical protein LBH94_00680 [Deltaproteobacteria bacterium]|jgi:intracellular multiplication protein IcmE|nr:hypothetical protein [Deltaproteobacteria bacterium]